MNVDGARNAKAEIFRQAFGFVQTKAAAGSVGIPADLADPPSFVGATMVGVSSVWRTVLRRQMSTVADGIGDTAAFGGRGGHLENFGDDGASIAFAPPSLRQRMSKAAGSIAVGIQPRRGKDDATVVLISSDAKMRAHPSVEAAIRLARGEARFVCVPEGRPLSCFQPARRRPLAMGSSIGHVEVTAGTLGGFVELADGAIAILSNNHVLANSDKASVGSKVIQPGRTDGGRVDADVIAKLLRAVPITPGLDTINVVDCAIATLSEGMMPSLSFAHQKAFENTSIALSTEEPFADDAVWKVGSTTGLTNGRVFAVEVDNYIVNMGTSWKPMRCRFDNQIHVYAEDRGFADHGDSGALVFDHNNNAIGLLFAGASGGGPTGTGLAVLNPLRTVLDKLDAKLWIG